MHVKLMDQLSLLNFTESARLVVFFSRLFLLFNLLSPQLADFNLQWT